MHNIQTPTIEEFNNMMPQYLGYFHAGKYRSVLMYDAQDPLAECEWKKWEYGYDNDIEGMDTVPNNEKH